MRVINTRPASDAAPLTRALTDMGHAVIAAPLLEVRLRSGAEPLDLDRVQAVLATSANGVRAFAEASEIRNLPLFAVGDASARVARELGFAGVTSAAGDVETLAAAVVEALDPADGILLHIAGTEVAGDLAGALTAANFEVRRVTLYEARAAESLPNGCAAALARGDADAVVFFSPRTARTFVRLAGDAGLADACQMLNAYCLSPAVAVEIDGLTWRGVHVAARPDQDSLLECVPDAAP